MSQQYHSGRHRFQGGRPSRFSHQPRRSKSQGQFIHPDRFVNQAIPFAEEEIVDPKHRFVDFGFAPVLEANITKRGYVTPTEIQDGAIEPVMAGRDVVGLANTGTGKTAVFILPIIHELVTKPEARRIAFVIAPTRELAEQIDQEFRAFAQGLRLYSALCVGGMGIGRQISDLRRHPHIVIGTPGRLKDLLERKLLHLDRVSWFVLDEVDRMLDMGFIRDIELLVGHLPKDRQTLCFSATMTPKIKEIVQRMLRDPLTVSVTRGTASQHVEQNVIEAATKEEKIEILSKLLQKPKFDKVLIFGQTKHGVQRLAEKLATQGIRATAIHGNKSQPQRQKALAAFKIGQMRVLVATDVAARGLDIPNVSHVINFDQPMTYDDYVHRIGRTGRAGKRGHALTFIAPRGRS